MKLSVLKKISTASKTAFAPKCKFDAVAYYFALYYCATWIHYQSKVDRSTDYITHFIEQYRRP